MKTPKCKHTCRFLSRIFCSVLSGRMFRAIDCVQLLRTFEFLWHQRARQVRRNLAPAVDLDKRLVVLATTLFL